MIPPVFIRCLNCPQFANLSNKKSCPSEDGQLWIRHMQVENIESYILLLSQTAQATEATIQPPAM